MAAIQIRRSRRSAGTMANNSSSDAADGEHGELVVGRVEQKCIGGE
jgi:hypothetical protein